MARPWNSSLYDSSRGAWYAPRIPQGFSHPPAQRTGMNFPVSSPDQGNFPPHPYLHTPPPSMHPPPAFHPPPPAPSFHPPPAPPSFHSPPPAPSFHSPPAPSFHTPPPPAPSFHPPPPSFTKPPPSLDPNFFPPNFQQQGCFPAHLTRFPTPMVISQPPITIPECLSLKQPISLKEIVKKRREIEQQYQSEPTRERSKHLALHLRNIHEKVKRVMSLIAELKAPAGVSTVIEHKREVEEILGFLCSPVVMEGVKARVNRASRQVRKRLSRKHRRGVLKKEQETLKQQIEDWEAKEREKLLREEETARMKKTADCVLGEVRWKQSQVRRMLDLVKLLKELRSLRCQRAGIGEDEEDNFWRLEMRLARQKEDYEKEEQTLKVMSGLDVEYNTNLEPEKDFPMDVQVIKDLYFGSSSLPQLDAESLVAVRRAWDKFLVSENQKCNNSSSVPLAWWPPPTAEWKPKAQCTDSDVQCSEHTEGHTNSENCET